MCLGWRQCWPGSLSLWFQIRVGQEGSLGASPLSTVTAQWGDLRCRGACLALSTDEDSPNPQQLLPSEPRRQRLPADSPSAAAPSQLLWLVGDSSASSLSRRSACPAPCTNCVRSDFNSKIFTPSLVGFSVTDWTRADTGATSITGPPLQDRPSQPRLPHVAPPLRDHPSRDQNSRPAGRPWAGAALPPPLWRLLSATPSEHAELTLLPEPRDRFALVLGIKPSSSTSFQFSSVQFSSVAQSYPTLCDPMDYSTPGLPVHHQLPELDQTHVHRVGDAIQPSHPLSSPSPPAFNLSQNQSFPMSQLFESGSQSIGVSTSTSVLPMNIQDWSPLGWTGWISLESKGPRVQGSKSQESSPTSQFKTVNSLALSFLYGPTLISIHDHWKNHSLD